jgi:hypothetical protein
VKGVLTGSRVYGTPREDSDIDLVLYGSQEDLCLLTGESDHRFQNPNVQHADGTYAGRSLRFGNLNVIYLDDYSGVNADLFSAWEAGTAFLEKIKPVTKEMACLVFETMFKAIRMKEKKEEIPF